jgi:hypothetical protein
MRAQRARLSRGNDVAKAMDYMLKRLKEGEQAIALPEAGSLATFVRFELRQGCFLECEIARPHRADVAARPRRRVDRVR